MGDIVEGMLPLFLQRDGDCVILGDLVRSDIVVVRVGAAEDKGFVGEED